MEIEIEIEIEIDKKRHKKILFYVKTGRNLLLL